MAHCIQRVPLQPLSQNQNDPTIQCQMCNCATFESYLRKHIQYNHMIHRRNIVDILYKLHYPAEIYGVQTQTANTWVTDLSLASLEHAGCFRDDPHIIHKENADPVKNLVLCSVCGEIESEMMIACDKCDGWYHWKCVGITEDPLPNDVWFCSHCINTETEDNLPAEESLPIESQLRDSGNRIETLGAFPQQQSSSQNTSTQASRKNVTVAGQKFSESQILIRERVPERNTRMGRVSQRDQNIENTATIEQQSTSQISAPDTNIITDIQDRKEEEEDPFTEVVRRKRKKRSTKIEQENRIENRVPIVTTEIDKEDTTPEESLGSLNAFQEPNFEDFDIGNTQVDDMNGDELDEFQEQKHDIFSSDPVESEKTKLKIVNTFSIKTKSRNPKSTRLGKRKEKKIGLLKLQEIIPSARKPLKILVGGKQIIPTEEATDDKQTERMITKEQKKAVIFRENKNPTKLRDTILDDREVVETWKGKGKGKGKQGRPKIVNPESDTFDQLKNKPIIQETNTSDSGKPPKKDFSLEEAQELKIRIPKLSSKDIEEKTKGARDINPEKPVNKLKIKRLSSVTKKKQTKQILTDDPDEEYLDEELDTSISKLDTKECKIVDEELDNSIPRHDTKESKKAGKKSSNSLFDLTPFIYRIHKGRRQRMKVHLSNRNNKMRLSQETIDFAKNYYLKKPEDWEQRQVYMNNQYMQLKCFKFIGDEYAPVVKNYKQINKKQIGPRFWKTLNRSPEKDMVSFYQDAKEILEMKKAQAFGTKISSNTSRKFSKEAMIACREPLDEIENEYQQPEISICIETDPKEKGKPGRKKKGVPTKHEEIIVIEDTEIQDSPKEHKIKSSIKKRSRKPSLTGRAKVALTFDTDTFVETKEDKKPKEHSPQRSRLNSILDTLRTKNMERIQKLHDSDSALEQPGPSYDRRPQYNIRYPSGSVVWAKMEESPWWPGMVDFCPDSEEYYWMEEGGAEPSWYHVVFFDKGEHVTRSWIRSEWIQVFDPEKTFDHPSLQDMDRSRLNDSLAMAINCLEKTRDQRLAKFSLATLFQGSWGKSPHPNKSPFHPFISDSWEPSFIDPSDPFSPIKLPKIPDDEENPERAAFLDLDNRKVGQHEHGEGREVKKEGYPPIVSEVPDGPTLFHCLMCDENVACTKSTISSHLTRHKVTLDDYPRIFVSHRDDEDMKMIMDWIKEDEENSESVSVSGQVSPVTTELNMTMEAAALLSRNAFWKNQRDKFVKDKFQCDLCKTITKNEESFEAHMQTHTERCTSPEADEDIPENADLIYDEPLPVVDQVQPIKDWICTKPQYFTGYSVVIKTKERRLANLELAFSNAPPPPPPKERAVQEPVLPSPRLSTNKSTTHSEDQSKTSSSKRESTTLVSKGMLKEYEQSKSLSKRKEDQPYKKDDDPLQKKQLGKLQIEDQKQKLQIESQKKTNEKKDNPKMSHSVDALISKPHETSRSIDVAGQKIDIETIEKTNLKERPNEFSEKKEDSSVPLLEKQPDKSESDNKILDVKSEEKEGSPVKEAIDLSMKLNI